MGANFFKPLKEKLKTLKEERKQQQQKQNEKVVQNKINYEQKNRYCMLQESWREKFTWVDHQKITDLYEHENISQKVIENLKKLNQKRCKNKTELLTQETTKIESVMICKCCRQNHYVGNNIKPEFCATVENLEKYPYLFCCTTFHLVEKEF